MATTGGALAARARATACRSIPLPGGFQPRAAVGYALVTALEAAALAGAAPSVRDEVEAAAVLAEALAAEWGPDGAGGRRGEVDRPRAARHGPGDRRRGADRGVAYRWKCQLNENAELPAFASELPEPDHNEVVGWGAARSSAGSPPCSSRTRGAHPRNALRTELTAELAAGGRRAVERVTARGETPVERLVSLVLLGDLVSLYAAVLRGADPAPVAAIDTLKARLAD